MAEIAAPVTDMFGVPLHYLDRCYYAKQPQRSAFSATVAIGAVERIERDHLVGVVVVLRDMDTGKENVRLARHVVRITA